MFTTIKKTIQASLTADWFGSAVLDEREKYYRKKNLLGKQFS